MPRVKLPSLQRKPQIISIIRWQNTSMKGRNEMGKKMGKDDKDLNGLKCQTRKKLTLNFSKWFLQVKKKSGQNAILQGQGKDR